MRLTCSLLAFRAVASEKLHESVLLRPSLDALAVVPDGVYVDATFGRGGHSREIMKLLGPQGRLIVFDQDPEAIAVAREWMNDEPRVHLEACNFSQLRERLDQLGLLGRCDGVLFDLGVSSPQLDQGERGFSFNKDAELDMRMDTRVGQTAAQWLAQADEAEIIRVLRQYGEEPKARRIAIAICRARDEEEITGTLQLASIIDKAVGGRRGKRTHPATRSFQAIRLHVNRELDVLTEVLPQAVAALRVGGRLAVISFHSLEDRIVKRYLRALANPPATDPVSAPPPPILRQVKRERCSEEEAALNPRARSATLRWAEKCRELAA